MREGQTFSSGTLLPWLGWRQGQDAGGGSLGLEGPFEIGGSDGHSVINCRIVFGRTELTCADRSVDLEHAGVIVATVTHGDSPSLSVQKFPETPSNSLTRTFRTLYEIKSDGSIVDYRWMPVVVAAN